MSVQHQIKRPRNARGQAGALDRLPSRTQIFVTVSLMLFLLMLVCSPKPPGETVVSAEFGCALPSPPSAAARTAAETVRPVDAVANRLAKQLVSTASVARALVAVEARGDAHREGDRQPAIPHPRIEQVAAKLSVVAKPTSPLTAKVELVFRGNDPRWSQALLDQLARQFLLEQPPSITADWRPAKLGLLRWQVDQAKHYERKALLELEDYWQRTAQRDDAVAPAADVARTSFQSAVASDARGDGQLHFATTHSEPAAAQRTINPEWSAKQRQLADLSAQVDKLLETVTPNHPRVKALSQQMADLQNQLVNTPQYLEARDNADEALLKANVPPAAATTTNEQYQQLAADYNAAVARREQAETNLWTLIDSGALGMRTDSQSVSRWMAMPPTVAHQRREYLQPTTLLICGILACLGGLVCVRVRRSLRPLSRVNTVDELRDSVSVPIVGQLTLDAPSRHAPRAIARLRFLRGAVIAAEVGLVLMLACFVIGALADSSVAMDFRADPLGVFTDSVATALASWW